MRLINVHTLEMREFVADIPEYIILSHRWTDDEIDFKDFKKGRRTDSTGYAKVQAFCNFVKLSREYVGEGYFVPEADWIWIDTCCIDKRSSAELSEAINSMYNWYANTKCCVVYLNDVGCSVDEHGVLSEEAYGQIERSEWFTRGWTLQELLAPYSICFCNDHWLHVGELRRPTPGMPSDIVMPPLFYHLIETVVKATGIPEKSLLAPSRGYTCFAEKMRWMSHRKTTRGEDIAYCLLGLVGLNMPLLYGEGQEAAFMRLQEEFIRRNTDESIFAWPRPEDSLSFGILASHPNQFQHTQAFHNFLYYSQLFNQKRSFNITNAGLSFEATAIRLFSSQYLVGLNCWQNGKRIMIAIDVDIPTNRIGLRRASRSNSLRKYVVKDDETGAYECTESWEVLKRRFQWKSLYTFGLYRVGKKKFVIRLQ